jgi:hypothetical protein
MTYGEEGVRVCSDGTMAPSRRAVPAQIVPETTLFYQTFQAHDTLEGSCLCGLDDPKCTTLRGMLMKDKLKIGDHVSWNSEAGRVSGTIVRVHTRNFDVNGYTHHASAEAPQYEIKSSKTEHIAFHKGPALTRVRD